MLLRCQQSSKNAQELLGAGKVFKRVQRIPYVKVPECAWVCRWWREAEGFKGRFAVIFPIDRENVTFVASAPIAELHKQGLPFNPDEPRSVQADLANADNLQRCMTVFHDFDERLLTVLFLFPANSLQACPMYRGIRSENITTAAGCGMVALGCIVEDIGKSYLAREGVGCRSCGRLTHQQ